MSGVTVLRDTPGVTWTQPLYIYIYIYIYVYIDGLGSSYTWCNLLLNSYFENPTVELHFLCVLNMYAKFYVNQM